jgi:ribonuclease E
MSATRNQKAVENRMRESLEIDRARIQVGRISRFGLLELSRQRLRPSLGETSSMVCPRCSGQGTIRDTESLALSLLRLIQDEATKERSAEIRVVVPIELATYLLNEKRDAIHTIESSNATRVLVIPNVDMQTPHYDIQRLRDDSDEVNANLASYEIEIESSTVVNEPVNKVTAQAPAQQAAIKAIPAARPPAAANPVKTKVAPTVIAAKPGLFKRAINALFGKTVEAKPELKKTEKAPASRNNQRSNNRGGQNRNNRNPQNRNRNRNNQGRDRNKVDSTNGKDTERKADRAIADRNKPTDNKRSSAGTNKQSAVDTNKPARRAKGTKSRAPQERKRGGTRSDNARTKEAEAKQAEKARQDVNEDKKIAPATPPAATAQKPKGQPKITDTTVVKAPVVESPVVESPVVESPVVDTEVPVAEAALVTPSTTDSATASAVKPKTTINVDPMAERTPIQPKPSQEQTPAAKPTTAPTISENKIEAANAETVTDTSTAAKPLSAKTQSSSIDNKKTALVKPVGRSSNDPRNHPTKKREFEIISVAATKQELPPAVKIEATKATIVRAKNDPREL